MNELPFVSWFVQEHLYVTRNWEYHRPTIGFSFGRVTIDILLHVAEVKENRSEKSYDQNDYFIHHAIR